MPSYAHQRKGKQIKAGNEPVSFTIFNEKQKVNQGRMLASNPWRCMELELRSIKKSAHDCLAYLRQAHDFHIAAEAAKATARPLLMYYSFLNLAKMLIKHKDARKNLDHATHGIKEAPKNTERKRFTLTAQEIEIQKVYGKYVPILKTFAEAVNWPPPTVGSCYNVCDLLAQVPASHRAYSHTRRCAEKLYFIEDAEYRYDHIKRKAWAILWVHKSKFNDAKPLAKLKSRSYFKKWFEQVEADEWHDDAIPFETKPKHYGKSSQDAIAHIGRQSINAGVVGILTPDGYRYYLSNFEPRPRLHQILAAYMAMFYFGSVARYRPADYEKMLQGKYGWIIEEFLVTQGHQFVYLLANCVLGQELVCPWAISASGLR